MYGYPPPYGYQPPPQYGFPPPQTPDEVAIYKKISKQVTKALKKAEAAKKKTPEKKEDTSKKKWTFTFRETVMLLLLSAMPLGGLQFVIYGMISKTVATYFGAH